MIFRRGILALMMDFCRQENYLNDIETYLRLLKAIKQIVRSNKSFCNSLGNKKQVYDFIITRFKSFQSQNKVSL